MNNEYRWKSLLGFILWLQPGLNSATSTIESSNSPICGIDKTFEILRGNLSSKAPDILTAAVNGGIRK